MAVPPITNPLWVKYPPEIPAKILKDRPETVREEIEPAFFQKTAIAVTHASSLEALTLPNSKETYVLEEKTQGIFRRIFGVSSFKVSQSCKQQLMPESALPQATIILDQTSLNGFVEVEINQSLDSLLPEKTSLTSVNKVGKMSKLFFPCCRT